MYYNFRIQRDANKLLGPWGWWDLEAWDSCRKWRLEMLGLERYQKSRVGVCRDRAEIWESEV